ncbi:MAG: cytochrome c3 family protein [Sulfuritalea sp.]|nr:cytochrome c3 family protein [Sulfuritalea sp.]
MRHAHPGSNQSALPRHSLPISLLAMLHLACLAVLGLAGSESHADVDLPSKFSNQSSITNTRHNLTQRQAAGGPSGSIMDPYRNDYVEVCVYCHTPHGANTTAGAPLWNRALPSTTYTLYSSNSLTQTVSQPGAASLVCLSCHDGQQAVDAIMNMPGSGRYQATPNSAFLNSWNNSRGPDATIHIGLNPNPALGCLTCHSSGAGVVGSGAADFTVAVIGTDLRDDHPVGVTFPATNGTGTDWKSPNSNGAGTKFFDDDADGRMEKGEIRLYGAGASATVECGSCHDPHGVATTGSLFNATFLRKPNAGSAVCLTCHSK